MAENKHGLSRAIPEAVKRAVRQNSGFGCVICGIAITHYEHVEPTFAEAEMHDPDCITLLCPNHHQRVTNGTLSKQIVKQAMLAPKALQAGFSREMFHLEAGVPTLLIGGVRLVNVPNIITIRGEVIFKVEPSEDVENEFTISVIINDSKGNEIFRIDKNEWFTQSTNWDVQIVGKELVIREAVGKVILRIHQDGNNITITDFNMIFGGISIIANPRELNINGFRMQGVNVNGAKSAFVFG